MEKGYILLNPISKYRFHIYNFEDIAAIQEKMKSQEFWKYYREMKKTCPTSSTVQEVRDFFKKKGELGRYSINYRIQHTGALCYKVSMIYFFKWIMENNLFNKVLITVTPYDEINCEAPTEIAEEVAARLHAIMVKAGKIFCTRCPLDADISRNKEDNSLPTHWVH
jgi:DNA polymerase I